MKKVKLWDVPTRISHWSLAVLVVAAFLTGLTGGGLMNLHGKIGALIAAIIGFRLVWGVLGTTYARFSTFVRGPATIMAYLRGQWRGPGHNPLGALSVLGMFAVLVLQILTGLFSDDDIAYQGPYNVLANAEIEALATSLHKFIYWLIAMLVALHLGAIAFYARVKGENLLTPMITGTKEIHLTDPHEPVKDASGGGWPALTVAIAVALTVYWLALGGPVDDLLPPTPSTAAPDW